MKNAVILGGGTYGEVFLTYLTEQGFTILGFFDDNEDSWGKLIHGLPVLGGMEKLLKNNLTQPIHQVFCPIGDNHIRTKYLALLHEKGFETPNFIHSSVLINKDVTIGKGVYLLPGVIIMPHTIIKDFVIISMGSHVAHHTILEDGVFISTGVNVGAGIHVQKKAFLGISSTVMTGVKVVGKNALIGSGAVVIRNIEDNHVVAGVPAKTLRVLKEKKENPPIQIANEHQKLKVNAMEIVGFDLVCHDLKTAEDIELYKKYLKNFKGFDAFYKIELFNVTNSETEQLKYFILTKNKEVICLMPFALRKIIIDDKDTTYNDVSSFYGYSGPLYNDKLKNEDLINFWHLVDAWYNKHNVVTEFMRFNLDGNHQNYSGIIAATLNNVKGVIIDNDEEQWNSFVPKVRNNYRKASGNGLEAKIYNQTISDEIINTFHTIYIGTMERNKAANNYYFTLNYFKQLIQANPASNAIIIIYKDDIPISTELILLNSATMYSFLGGTVSDYFHLRPNDFLKIEALKWGKTQGFKNYVLGGGRINGDSLYKYKKSFFPKNEDVVFYTGRKIINQDIYEKLVTLNNKYTYTLNEKDIINDFFPLYRK